MVTDLTGQRFGRLVVLERAENSKGGHTCWKVVCECGGTKTVYGSNLSAAITRSCGCLRHETAAVTGSKTVGNKNSLKHGHSGGVKKSRIYNSWQSMKKRCLSPNCKSYPNYGGRGIKICDRWLESFENFLADMGEPPAGTSLGRKGDIGNYEPGNVSWQTQAEQVANWRPDRNLGGGWNKKIKAPDFSDALPISQLNEIQVSI